VSLQTIALRQRVLQMDARNLVYGMFGHVDAGVLQQKSTGFLDFGTGFKNPNFAEIGKAD